jgi:hypothetical protein
MYPCTLCITFSSGCCPINHRMCSALKRMMLLNVLEPTILGRCTVRLTDHFVERMSSLLGSTYRKATWFWSLWECGEYELLLSCWLCFFEWPKMFFFPYCIFTEPTNSYITEQSKQSSTHSKFPLQQVQYHPTLQLSLHAFFFISLTIHALQSNHLTRNNFPTPPTNETLVINQVIHQLAFLFHSPVFQSTSNVFVWSWWFHWGSIGFRRIVVMKRVQRGSISVNVYLFCEEMEHPMKDIRHSFQTCLWMSKRTVGINNEKASCFFECKGASLEMGTCRSDTLSIHISQYLVPNLHFVGEINHPKDTQGRILSEWCLFELLKRERERG